MAPSSSFPAADLRDLARALRRRRLSAVELTAWTLERLGRLGPALIAVDTLLPERALADARRADARLARATGGPLVGIPYGAKALIAPDAAAVSRLKRAGAVLTARLAVETARGGWARLGAIAAAAALTQGAGYGVNPWNRAHWAGGSSSGPASAVAAGLLPCALGTETSGSIVGPAAFCGLSAIRPTFGAVSLSGVVPLAWTLDKVGLLAWTAEDCATVLAALTGTTAPPLDASLRRRTRRAKLRLGVVEAEFALAGESARGALLRGLAELRALGPAVAPAVIPDGSYGAMVDTVMGAEGGHTFHGLITSSRFPSLVSPAQRAAIELGLTLPAHAYLRTIDERRGIAAAFAGLFEACDVLVAPAQPRTAPTLEEMAARTSRPRPAAALTPASNLAGLPAAVFPCGLGTDGLPVGLQLVGPPHSEPLLLGLAAAYQRETGHHLRRAPLALEP